MRNLYASLVLIVFTALSFVAPPSQAAPTAGTAVRVTYPQANVGTSSWVPLFTNTTRGIKGLTAYNSALSPLEVGIAFAGSDAGSEVRQMIIPGALQSADGVVTPSNIFYPMAVGYGARISVRALGSAATIGELDMSLFYN